MAVVRRAVHQLGACVMIVFGLLACTATTGRQADVAASRPAAPTPGGRIRGGFAPPAGTGRSLIRVGLLLPFESSDPALREAARSMALAAELALFKAPDAGLLLIPKDTSGSAEQAAAAAEAAVADGADLIIGPLLATGVRAAADVARAEDIPIVAFSSDRTVGGDGVYLLSYQIEDDIRAMVDFAMRKGDGAFAVLAPDTPYGRLGAETAAMEAYVRGGEMIATQFYVGGAEGAQQAARSLSQYDRRAQALSRRRALVDRLRAVEPEAAAAEAERLEDLDTWGQPDFDAVILLEDGQETRAVAALLPFFDVDTREIDVLGASIWADDSLSGEPALSGAYYPGSPPEAFTGFAQDYRRAFGARPSRLAALAYDAVALAAILAVDDPIRPFEERNFMDPSGFAGVTGVFRFTAFGGVDRNLAIFQIGRSGDSLAERAPESFPDQAF